MRTPMNGLAIWIDEEVEMENGDEPRSHDWAGGCEEGARMQSLSSWFWTDSWQILAFDRGLFGKLGAYVL